MDAFNLIFCFNLNSLLSAPSLRTHFVLVAFKCVVLLLIRLVAVRMSVLFSGLQRRLDSCVDISVSEKHTASVFSAEKVCSSETWRLRTALTSQKTDVGTLTAVRPRTSRVPELFFVRRME